jgi:hypothetical protein
MFPEQWIEQHGQTAWPARSTNLNPSDFYLWRHINSDVYATAVSDIQDLQQ